MLLACQTWLRIMDVKQSLFETVNTLRNQVETKRKQKVLRRYSDIHSPSCIYVYPYTKVQATCFSNDLYILLLFIGYFTTKAVMRLYIASPDLCLPPALTLVSHSAYSSALKMEEICSSETSVDFERTTRRYMPEDSTVIPCFSRSLTSRFELFAEAPYNTTFS
jgi:hypothetical protein